MELCKRFYVGLDSDTQREVFTKALNRLAGDVPELVTIFVRAKGDEEHLDQIASDCGVSKSTISSLCKMAKEILALMIEEELDARGIMLPPTGTKVK